MKLLARVEGSDNLSEVIRRIGRLGATVSILRISNREVVCVSYNLGSFQSKTVTWNTFSKALEGLDYKMAWN